MATQGLLSSINGTLLPPIITDPIFKKTSESSAVMQLARSVPLSLTAQTAIPVPMDVPVAGWISEASQKAPATSGMGVKTMVGKKLAVLVPVSQEVAMTNAAGLYDQLQQDLPTAMARSFDFAAIHGLDLKSGGAGPFNDYLLMTSNAQVIGATAASSGGAWADLWKGVQQVEYQPGMEFSGFAADRRIRSELALSVDVNGRPLFIANALAGNSGINVDDALIDYPVAFNSGISGMYYRAGNAVQVVTVSGSPTGGTFVLEIDGQPTAPIAYNAAASVVQTAVQALGGTLASAAVTGSGGGPYTVTFAVGPGQLIVGLGKGLTGGTTPSVSVTLSPTNDTGLRAVGGDFSQCAYGVGMDITIKVSTEGSYYDGATWHSAFQENLVLLLCEAYYGFVVGNPNAFVAYTHATGS